MIKNIQKNKKKEIKKLSPIESFFLLESLHKEKIQSFFKNFYQSGFQYSFYNILFEKINLKIRFFRFIHMFRQSNTNETKKKKKRSFKKKYLSSKQNVNSRSLFDLYKKKPFLKKQKTKKSPTPLKKRKKGGSFFKEENFFFSSIDSVRGIPEKKSIKELSPSGEPLLQHGFSYRIETERDLSSFVGNPFHFHWIGGNRMGGTSQYLLDLILFFLKKRIPYRRVCSILFQELRKLSYIEGIRITYAGRLGGKTNKAVRSKKETRKAGKPSLHIFSAKIDFAQGEVQTKFGMIGIKVWIRYK